jgi:hypothetical protein
VTPARLSRTLARSGLVVTDLPRQEVLVAFAEDGQPIVVDVIEDRVATPTPAPAADQETVIDARRLTFDAQEQIVFRCGRATITLTRAGKIIIRGAYVTSSSSGVNRIRGGSVQIN